MSYTRETFRTAAKVARTAVLAVVATKAAEVTNEVIERIKERRRESD